MSLRRSLELVIYIAVGILWVGSTILYAIYAPPDATLDARWLSFVAMTLVIFGYPIYWYRRYWRHPSFWNALLKFFALHVAAWLALLLSEQRVSLMVLGFSLPIEWTFLLPYVEKAAKAKPRKKKKKRDSGAGSNSSDSSST